MFAPHRLFISKPFPIHPFTSYVHQCPIDSHYCPARASYGVGIEPILTACRPSLSLWRVGLISILSLRMAESIWMYLPLLVCPLTEPIWTTHIRITVMRHLRGIQWYGEDSNAFPARPWRNCWRNCWRDCWNDCWGDRWRSRGGYVGRIAEEVAGHVAAIRGSIQIHENDGASRTRASPPSRHMDPVSRRGPRRVPLASEQVERSFGAHVGPVPGRRLRRGFTPRSSLR